MTVSQGYVPDVHDPAVPEPAVVREQLERICGHPILSRARALQNILRFTVLETLNGRSEDIKEYTIGAFVLGKGDSFDPRFSSIVRTQVWNLRARLDEYYILNPGGIRISFSPGSYIPEFHQEQRERHGRPRLSPLWFRDCRTSISGIAAPPLSADAERRGNSPRPSSFCRG